MIPLTVLISFKFIRMLDSHLFGFSCFKANFDQKANLYRPLVLFSYVSLVLTTLPTLGVLIYVLITFHETTTVFVLALDSLVITVLILLFTVYEIIILNLALAEVPKSTSSVCVNVTPPDIGLNSQKFNIFTKAQETDRTNVIMETDACAKIYPEPEDENYKETFFDILCEHNNSDVHSRNTGEYIQTEDDNPSFNENNKVSKLKQDI